MRIHAGLDRAALGAAAAEALAQALVRQAEARGQVTLAVCGGRSVGGIFEALRGRREVPWARVHVFAVDERLVPQDHPDSNFRLAREGFIDALRAEGRLPSDNVHPFVLDDAAPGAGCARLNRELRSLGGTLDVLLLSAGEDGHIAALFPDHHSVLDEAEGFIVMDDAPKAPPRRVTASRRLIQRAAAAALLFVGEAKRGALRRFLDPATMWRACPAKLAQSLPDLHVFTDLEVP